VKLFGDSFNSTERLGDSGKKVIFILMIKRIVSPELEKMKGEKKEKLRIEKTI
jgi:hypothetical protein